MNSSMTEGTPVFLRQLAIAWLKSSIKCNRKSHFDAVIRGRLRFWGINPIQIGRSQYVCKRRFARVGDRRHICVTSADWVASKVASY